MKINYKKIRKNIPHNLQVSRKGNYEVSYVDSFKDPDILGETRFDPKQIVIKNGQSDREMVHTLFHETLHAISEEYDVGLTETQVKKLENSLYYFIKNVIIISKGR